MSKISEYATAQGEVNTRIAASIQDIANDIGSLNDTILVLQSTEGQVTAEDQALLDSLQTQGAALATSLEELGAKTPAPTDPAVNPLRSAAAKGRFTTDKNGNRIDNQTGRVMNVDPTTQPTSPPVQSAVVDAIKNPKPGVPPISDHNPLVENPAPAEVHPRHAAHKK